MRNKLKGWSEGIISRDLISFGYTHKKGSIVRYKRYKTQPYNDGFKLTQYEWHYLDQNNYNLVRTTERIIEGVEYIKEPYIR